MQGKPIETAPRDGTIIIASIARYYGVPDTGHYRFERVSWRNDGTPYSSHCDWHPIGQDNSTYGEGCFIAWWPDGTPEAELERRPRTNWKWRPSNGTEGEIFQEQFCENCVHDRAYREDKTRGVPCKVLTMIMACDIGDPEYPEEFSEKDGDRRCTKFQRVIEEKLVFDDEGGLVDTGARCEHTPDMFGE